MSVKMMESESSTRKSENKIPKRKWQGREAPVLAGHYTNKKTTRAETTF